MRRFVLIAIFAAIAVALGLAFLTVPNLELVTTTFFLAGYFLGSKDGVIAAILGEFVYSLLNPLGTAAPPLLIAQISGMAITAFVGGMLSKNKHFRLSHSIFRLPFQKQAVHKTQNNSDRKIKFQPKYAILFGVTGFVLTVAFDLFTTVSFLLFAGLTFKKFMVSLIYGMYFYLIHIGMNTLIFAFLVPMIISLLQTSTYLHRATVR